MAFPLVAVPKPRPRILDKRDAQREADAEKRLAYAAVDARDQKRCRCCGRKGHPNATTALGRIHRHHIEERGKDGGPMAAWNLLSLCWICHALVHAKQIFILGWNADRIVPFEIKEAAVVEVFGTKELPKHVRIVL